MTHGLRFASAVLPGLARAPAGRRGRPHGLDPELELLVIAGSAVLGLLTALAAACSSFHGAL